MSDDSLFFTSALALREKIISKEISCAKLTQLFLNRIDEKNSSLHALSYIDREDALAYAKKVDEMVAKGDFSKPLLGVPLVVPDSVSMLRTPTTFGSLLLQDNIPTEEDVEVTLLKNAGAVILGKTAISEFGLFPDTVSLLNEPCVNPLNFIYSAGGPNGGSGSAIKGGLASLALASDNLGSLRLTSGFCGLFGLMPTRGLVPHIRHHFLPASERLFFRKGIVANTPLDIEKMLEVLSHEDCRDPIHCKKAHQPHLKNKEYENRPLRIGYSKDLGFLDVDPEVAKIVKGSLERFKSLGHLVHEVKLNLSEDVLHHMANMFGADRFIMISRVLKGQKAITEYTKMWLRHGNQVTGVQYSLAETYMLWLQRELDVLFESCDVLVTPLFAKQPFLSGQVPVTNVIDEMQYFGFTCPFNMASNPAMAVPAGVNAVQMPVGVQLIARPFAEELLLFLSKQLFDKSRL